MTLVLAAGSILDHPPGVLLAAAAAAGFDGVGLRVSGEHDVADAAGLRSRAAALGLAVHDVEVHRISGQPLDPRPLVERAAALGASCVLAVSDSADLGPSIRQFAEFAAVCADHGVVPALEYMAWTTPSTPAGAIEVAHATGCRVVLDVLHHVRVGGTLDDVDAIVGAGVLGWAQLCDAPRHVPSDTGLIDEARHHRLPPGAGELPLEAIVARLPPGTTWSVEVQADDLLGVAPGPRARLLHSAAMSVLARAQPPRSTG